MTEPTIYRAMLESPADPQTAGAGGPALVVLASDYSALREQTARLHLELAQAKLYEDAAANLEAECERLRADAERVEYCVANCLALDFAYGEHVDCALVIQLPKGGRYPANFRNIIDAARAAAAPGDGHE